MASTREVRLADGRVLRIHETGARGEPGSLTLVWHHGSPQTGALFEPLVSAAGERGIQLVSYGRPGYGGSSARPGRDVASAADDVRQVADALGVERFSVMGASGGGPHVLACAALLPDRVAGAVCLAGLAPLTHAFDWYEGMVSDGGLRAAVDGRAARARYAASEVFDPTVFTPSDWAALRGTWSSLGADAERAGSAGPDGLIDDDVAFVTPWGFDVAGIAAPVLLVQGGQDRVVPPAHTEWLLRSCPSAELWLRPRDGHISILDAIPVAMDWLLAAAGSRLGRS